jgi:hypothetical protein
VELGEREYPFANGNIPASNRNNPSVNMNKHHPTGIKKLSV